MFHKKTLFLQPVSTTKRNMTMLNAYFYGYYFYFAGTCGAEDRM